MSRPEWLRTFVAIYRTGSVSDGARARHLSQPAASQQLAGLERAVGSPLFVRQRGGVRPTAKGRDLYASVADPLDRIEGVLSGLDAGEIALPAARLRVGASAERFEHVLLARLATTTLAVDAVFGPDGELHERLAHGDLDIAVTTALPARRLAEATVVGEQRFVLVAAPGLAPAARLRSPVRLGDWLTGRPWVSFSQELPITRRFWQQTLGRPFAADLRLVAPDLRVVVAAVEQGVGVSLLPDFVCEDALRAHRLVELFPVGDLIAPEPWHACVRPSDAARADVRRALDALSGPSPVRGGDPSR